MLILIINSEQYNNKKYILNKMEINNEESTICRKWKFIIYF